MFASHPIIVVLEKYSKEFIGQTWQIRNVTITFSLPTPYNYLQSKARKKIKSEIFTFPSKTSDLRFEGNNLSFCWMR